MSGLADLPDIELGLSSDGASKEARANQRVVVAMSRRR